MGWKLNIGLGIAALALVYVFRNQIMSIFQGAGQTLGSAIGTGVGSGVAAIPTGFSQGLIGGLTGQDLSGRSLSAIVTQPGVGFNTSYKTPFGLFDWLFPNTNPTVPSLNTPNKSDSPPNQGNRDYYDSANLPSIGNPADWVTMIGGPKGGSSTQADAHTQAISNTNNNAPNNIARGWGFDPRSGMIVPHPPQ